MLIKTWSGEEFELDFEPKNYVTQAGAAKALYKALRKAAQAYGHDPDIEVAIWKPGENGRGWRVSWEAGPYEWAIAASWQCQNFEDGGWFTEPHYSFDLCFTD